jgi:2-dehydropantoate 2-reductase
MEPKRICVFGAGAVGGHLAAKLAAAGHDVSVIARGANLESIRARGLTLRTKIDGADRTISGRVRASDRAADLGPQDFVFVTTKANALAAIAEAVPTLSHAETAFVFAQNGVPWWYAQGLSSSRPAPPDLSRLDPGGVLARALVPERVIGAVVYSSNDPIEPGVVENRSPGRNMLVLGEPDDRASKRVSDLRPLLAAADMPSPATDDIRQSVWDKITMNFASTLCVPVGEPIRVTIEDPALRALRDRLFAEGRAIAKAHGVSPENAVKRPGGAQPSTPSNHKPSMLQDYELGRPMEVEAILAAPCAFARAAGLETPMLDALTAITARLATRKGLYSAAP